MKKSILFLVLVLLFTAASAQTAKREKWVVMDAMNVHTAKPFGSFSGLFGREVHPGFEAGMGWNWKSKSRHDWLQEAKLGYFYHRWVQHSIALYTELGYRYKLPAQFSIEARLGGGYSRVIVANQVFVIDIDKNREYKQITSGRGQAIVTTSFVLNKSLGKEKDKRIFFQYQQRLQTPFVKSYIPLLPYNIAAVGFALSFHSKS